jgi:hypothetical protein
MNWKNAGVFLAGVVLGAATAGADFWEQLGILRWAVSREEIMLRAVIVALCWAGASLAGVLLARRFVRAPSDSESTPTSPSGANGGAGPSARGGVGECAWPEWDRPQPPQPPLPRP